MQRTGQVYSRSGGTSAPAEKRHRTHTYGFLGRAQNVVFGCWVSRTAGDRWPQQTRTTAASATDARRGGIGQAVPARQCVPGCPTPSTVASPGSLVSLGSARSGARDREVPGGGPRHLWASSTGVNKHVPPFPSETEKEPGTGKSQGERVSRCALRGDAGSERASWREKASGSYLLQSLSKLVLVMVRRGGQKSKDTLITLNQV